MRITKKGDRRLRRAALAVAFSLAALVVAGGGCAQENSLVDGECITGYTQCNVDCFDLANDSANCGACGNACSTGTLCGGGVCGGPIDGSADATLDGDARADASDKDRPSFDSPVDGTHTDVAEASTGDSSADSNVTPDAPVDACAPPYETAAHCGDCFTVCSGVNDACKATDGGFACAPLCDPPQFNCSAVCVDRQTDPFNCGVCGKFCASNICSGGLCQGVTAGDVVVIGHDYLSTPAAAAQSRILTNAVFIQRSNPLRVMSYERYGEAAAITTVKGILNSAAMQLNRTIAFTATVTDNDIPNTLTSATQDVLLVYDQRNAAPGVLTTLGTAWASTLTTFTKAGGVVVILDGAAGATAEMPQFLTSAGLLSVTAHASLTAAEPVTVVGPSDVVGVGVLSPYGAGSRSVRFTAAAPSATVTYIVRDSLTNDPVVIHRTTP